MKKSFSFPKFIRSTYVAVNTIFVIWLLLCKWVSFHDPSNSPTSLSLISFTCLFAAFGNVAFIFLWLFTKKKLRALFSIIAIAICWSVCRPLIGLNYFGRNNISSAETTGLKVMTWNVHMFDLGEWTKDKASKAKILKLIEDENPDILCLEEFYWDSKEPTEPYTDILQKLGYPYVKLVTENINRKEMITSNASKTDMINVGHAIFSKYPLRNEQHYEIHSENKKMLGVEVVVDSNNIFCLNVVHLTSVGFGRKEMDYISDVKQKGVEAQDEDQSKSLLKKLRNASASRAGLANKIDSFKKTMDYPVIICGDFNDVPGSYVYSKVKGDLRDAFVEKGAGLGRTYRNISPTLRIDYIFYDNEALQIEGYNRPNVALSDHFPVIANFSLKKKTIKN
ncbi:endonuclease/exonuclease/phosphatase family protein [Taibaiella lutea]|uniref:Endonuclease/exonuclease/phosphatase family protein n=1 Tax=Taibaiella lutea TaxID=2608001 RepID=A0A5M6CPI3_9BACT|nr:endonuclease/exonuclease/phosphatase family protein [Taibaiella lutea]KAA5537161.1 endonuclease/exonuclease/phosphatase family protein [Taibaiella lutea]